MSDSLNQFTPLIGKLQMLIARGFPKSQDELNFKARLEKCKQKVCGASPSCSYMVHTVSV